MLTAVLLSAAVYASAGLVLTAVAASHNVATMRAHHDAVARRRGQLAADAATILIVALAVLGWPRMLPSLLRLYRPAAPVAETEDAR